MNIERFHARDLVQLFSKRKIATMAELKEALGTAADITIFRKLVQLSYRTSYSHRGRYYTLDGLPVYDEWGLWSFREVWFSKRGTLLSTAAALVDEAEAGFFAAALENLLHVEVKGALLKLWQQGRVARDSLSGRYLYCSARAAVRRGQLVARRVRDAEGTIGGPLIRVEVMPDELKAAIILFFSLLDEKQRRLYAGLESLKIGHGGDRRIADLLGVDAGTVARGRQDLLRQDLELDRIRRPGGGRKLLEKKRQA